jgi:tetratricopeptide (TPR) repeat protein
MSMIEPMEAEAPTAPMREAPTQYYEALTGLVERLNPNTREMRAQVYDRVRELLVMEAQESDPPWELLEVVREQRALEEAIKEIEADYDFEEQRRRSRLPGAEEWRELERSLPPGARRADENRETRQKRPDRRDELKVRETRGRQLPVAQQRRQRAGYDEAEFEQASGRGHAVQRFRLSNWRLPDPRQLILLGTMLATAAAAYLSVAAILGIYPFGKSTAVPPPQAEQGTKPETPVAPPLLRITPAEWVERGNAASRDGDYDTAIEAYGNAIRGGQRTVSVFNNRAYAFWVKGETNRAIADYDEALRVEPDNIVALANRAVAYNFRGDFELAVRDLDRALKLEPNNADIWNSRCWGRALAEQLKEALADCAEALRLRPNDANTYDSRGFVYLKMNQPDRAISDYTEALRINPRLAGALYGRGIAKQRKGDRTGSTDIAAAKAMKPEIEAIFSRYGIR